MRHFFLDAVFECSLDDVDKIFEQDWFLHHAELKDEQKISRFVYKIRNEEKRALTKHLNGRVCDFKDHNVLNHRRSNFIAKPQFRESN